MFQKTFLLSLILFTVSGFVFSQSSTLKYAESVQKFGKVDEGVKIELSYNFVNKGDKPVVINDSKVNCSCTKVNFPSSPIKPSEEGVVTVSFDTNGKIGYQERKIELTTNMGIDVITFKGVVKATEETKSEHKAH